MRTSSDEGRATGPRANEAPPSFTLDVYVEGQKVRRRARVWLHESALRFDGLELRFASVFWVSRRAGMLLVFARDFTAALKGPGADLDELARALERRSDRNEQRRRLLQPLAREVVVCTAGTAVNGRVGDERLRGLYLAVFTQRAVHLVSRGERSTVWWPVERAERTAGAGPRGGQERLRLTAPDTALELLYLFPEEIGAVLRVADRDPPRRPEREDGAADELEMFARVEVAPPVPVRLPEFSVSVATIREASIRAADAVALDPATGGPGREFFEIHFQELGEIALGPLMLRKSAAGGARGLARAVEAMDAAQLREDARAAFGAATDRLYGVYAAELDRRLGRRRISAESMAALRAGEGEREGLRSRARDLVDRMEPTFERVAARQALLMQRLRALETGPPGPGAEAVDEAADEWRAELLRLDRAFGAAWRELLEEITVLWSGRLLGRLARLEAIPRRRVPDRLRRLAWVAGLLIVAVALFLILR